jgi:hypothetical protein
LRHPLGEIELTVALAGFESCYEQGDARLDVGDVRLDLCDQGLVPRDCVRGSIQVAVE